MWQNLNRLSDCVFSAAVHVNIKYQQIKQYKWINIVLNVFCCAEIVVLLWVFFLFFSVQLCFGVHNWIIVHPAIWQLFCHDVWRLLCNPPTRYCCDFRNSQRGMGLWHGSVRDRNWLQKHLNKIFVLRFFIIIFALLEQKYHLCEMCSISAVSWMILNSCSSGALQWCTNISGNMCVRWQWLVSWLPVYCEWFSRDPRTPPGIRPQ